MKPVLQRTGKPGQVPFYDRPVAFLYGPLPKLLGQPGGGFAGACEHEDARHRPIEPMDNPEEDVAWLPVFLFQIAFDCTIQCFFRPLIVRTQATGRLRNGQAMIVFIKDVEWWQGHNVIHRAGTAMSTSRPLFHATRATHPSLLLVGGNEIAYEDGWNAVDHKEPRSRWKHASLQSGAWMYHRSISASQPTECSTVQRICALVRCAWQKPFRPSRPYCFACTRWSGVRPPPMSGDGFPTEGA